MSQAGLSEFFAMGGHGLYVWLSYGASVVIVLYNVVSVRLRLRRVVREARDRARRERSAQSGSVRAAQAGVVQRENLRADESETS